MVLKVSVHILQFTSIAAGVVGILISFSNEKIYSFVAMNN